MSSPWKQYSLIMAEISLLLCPVFKNTKTRSLMQMILEAAFSKGSKTEELRWSRRGWRDHFGKSNASFTRSHLFHGRNNIQNSLILIQIKIEQGLSRFNASIITVKTSTGSQLFIEKFSTLKVPNEEALTSSSLRLRLARNLPKLAQPHWNCLVVACLMAFSSKNRHVCHNL